MNHEIIDDVIKGNLHRYDPFDSSFYYSQEEIKAFANAVGIEPEMVRVDRRGDLVMKPLSKRESQPVK